MTVDDQRKVRIERMAKLARVYRGWSAAQMWGKRERNSVTTRVTWLRAAAVCAALCG